ncbi:hypothetical protein KGQ19_26840 [Catenulispora sp. NL8]|uniref:Uncharacterized protein n=1 Tax=Catenulispora pinistramenti TaxID=2705254 RepID=A0ABS5KWR6_9ACTN|nr:hypothetical protein [Catenulispora pinistramenti]MBS2550493.1 hypothetical protein [Catenulispora pinistramenti]
MSRHLLPNPDGAEPGTETVAGWDQPMKTYFLMINPPSGSDTEPVWLGRDQGEFYTLEPFIQALAKHGVRLVDTLFAELYFDRDLGRSNTVTDWRSGEPVQLA